MKAAGGAIVKQQSALLDELGRLMRQIGASAQQTNYAYDRTDNLTQVTDPRSNLYACPARGPLLRSSRAFAARRSSTGASRRAYRSAYDALSRLIRTTDQESAQVNLTRDGQDQVTAYQDPRSITTRYVRNGFGEVIQEASPDAGTTVVVRDARGLVTQETDGRGTVANLAYDAAGRLLSVAYPSAPADNVTYTYDSTAGNSFGIGRLFKMSDGSGLTRWYYDEQGRVHTQRRTIGSIVYLTSHAYEPAPRAGSGRSDRKSEYWTDLPELRSAGSHSPPLIDRHKGKE